MVKPYVSFTPEAGAIVCERLAAGESLTTICASDPSLPDRRTIQRYERDNEEFSAAIAHAREQGLDAIGEEIVAISDKQREVVKENGGTYDPDVQRDTLRVRARMWYLSKLGPKRYGDKVAVEHSGEMNISERLLAARKRTGK